MLLRRRPSTERARALRSRRDLRGAHPTTSARSCARRSKAYGRHADAEFAAALAYRALFSLVPFVALLAAVLDAVLSPGAREDVVDWLLGALPGTEVQASVEREVARSGALTSVAGLVALGRADLVGQRDDQLPARLAQGHLGDRSKRPDFVRAKLRDFLAVGVLATLVLAGFGLSLLTQIAIQAGVSATDAIGLTEAGGFVSVELRAARLGGRDVRRAAGRLRPRRARPSAVRGAVAERARGRAGHRRRRRRLRVLPRPDRELQLDLRAARRGARVPGADLRGRAARAVRRGTGRRDRPISS